MFARAHAHLHPHPFFSPLSTAPLWDERAAVVAGKKAVDKYDIPDSDEAGGGHDDDVRGTEEPSAAFALLCIRQTCAHTHA